jgi:hypothetical protein
VKIEPISIELTTVAAVAGLTKDDALVIDADANVSIRSDTREYRSCYPNYGEGLVDKRDSGVVPKNRDWTRCASLGAVMSLGD